MKSLRFLVVGALFTMPFFVFAQTSTSTAEQPSQVNAGTVFEGQIDQLTASRLYLLPSITEVRSNAIRDLLDVKIRPKNPGPDETINISIESYLSDMNKASISWAINGKEVLKGTGKTSFSFQNGPSGKTTRLTISITTNAGEFFTKEYSWTPVGVTLFWEADTYTPPFYKGKPLLSPQATVKVVATPDNIGAGNALGAGNFVYLWEKGGSSISEASGFGKNYFSFVGPKPYDETNVKVLVSSVDDSIKSEARAYLTLSNPFILFYDKNPLLGVLYNKPFSASFSLTGKEFSLVAEPYFFSNERGDSPSFKYTWLINGKEVVNSGRKITLRNETGGKGSSEVSLSMRGMKQSFQSAGRSVRVNFTEAASLTRPIF